MSDKEKQIYEFDEFRLDLRKRQLFRGSELVPLYSKAFDLLSVLVKNSGLNLSKDELLDRVWPGQILEEANLSVTVSAVRKALGEKASEPRYIITIPGLGYRFVADFNDGRLPAPSLVLESETISQITIDEESTSDGVLVAARPVKLIADGSDANVNVVPYDVASAKPSYFNRRSLLIGVVGIILATTTIFLVRKFQRSAVAASRFANFKVTPVTNSGRLGNVAISADGKLFAFNQKGGGEHSNLNALYLGQVSGEKTVELIAPAEVFYRHLEYASDGSAIFFTRQDQGQTECALYRISTLGGLPVKLHDNVGFFFTVAPDDHRVAFVRDDAVNQTSSILIADLGSNSESTLLTLPRERRLDHFTGWSPDGLTIAFASTRDNKDSSQSIFVAQANNGEIKALTETNWRDVQRIAWLKDGSGLFIIAAGNQPDDTRQVWFVSVPSGEAQRITNDTSLYDRGLSVSANPNIFLLVQLKQFNNLWTGPAEKTDEAKQITFITFNMKDGNFAFDWLPQNRIVYASSQAQGLNLSTMDADGKNVRELTSPGNDDSYPSATGDGRFIVFSSFRSGTEQIWRIDADGSNAKQLTTCASNSQPAASPDGKWVAFTSTCDGTKALWRMPIEGGEPQRLTDRAASWPWFSPDSKSIACGFESSTGKWQLAVIPIIGGSPQRLFDVTPRAQFNFAIRWTPDGKAVTYRDSSTGIWRQPIEGGPPQQIPNLPQDKFYCYGWSRDGKLFTFSRGQEIRDAVLISNEK